MQIGVLMTSGRVLLGDRGYGASVAVAVSVLALGASVTFALSGGGNWSRDLYLALAQHSLFELGEILSTVALLGLVATWGVMAVLWLVGRRVRRLAALVAGGVGAVVAYLSSELLKELFANTRPCTTYEIALAASCPSAENWSYPSNHTVIACALAASLIMARPRLAFLAVPLAGITAASRILSGHHYPHDMLGGAAWGSSVSVALIVVAAPPVYLGLQQLSRSIGHSPGAQSKAASHIR